MVPAMAMLPEPDPLFNALTPMSVMGLAKAIVALSVVIDPAKLTGPVPFWVKEPLMLAVLPADSVIVPELVTVTLPPPVVVTLPLRVKFTPVSVIPNAPLVVRLPVELIVPVDVILSELAETLSTEMLFALLTITSPSGVTLPALASSDRLPVPAASVKLPPPLSVLEKVIGWLLFDVFKLGLPDMTTGPVNDTLPLFVATEPEKSVVPEPVWRNEPSGFAVPAKVKVPLFLTEIDEPACVLTEAVLGTLRFRPVNWKPMLLTMDTVPETVVVPVPAD